MSRYEFERTDDPNERCEICQYKRVPGTTRCPRHGANKQLEAFQRQHTYDLRADEVRRRVNLLAADPSRYRLDEELGILRLTLETSLNELTSDGSLTNLFTHSETIASLITRIERLVQSCTTQSTKLKLLMTPEDLVEIVEILANIVAEEVDDYEALKRISKRIGEALSAQFNSLETGFTDDGATLQLDDEASVY